MTVSLTSRSYFQISKLLYTHSGNAILALGEDGIHLLWRWLANNGRVLFCSILSASLFVDFTCSILFSHSPYFHHKNLLKQQQVSTRSAPRLWQPNNGIQMINDVRDNGSKPCLALSKNDSYIASSCGKMISLFNMITFKVTVVVVVIVRYISFCI